MTNISNYIVKIASKAELGSGFIYMPLAQPEKAYIFTARHCIYGKGLGNGAVKTDISISFYGNDRETTIYNIKEADVLLTGSNNLTEDVAIIVVERNEMPDLCVSAQCPRLIELQGAESDCFVVGVPKVTNNLFPRTLKNCVIEIDKDSNTQIQVSVKDAIVDNYNADDLVEGYSGSGYFISDGKSQYAFGIVSQYESPSKRLIGNTFSLVNQILEQKGLPKIELVKIETDIEIIESIDRLNENTNRVLGRIKANIGEVHLERPVLESDLSDQIVQNRFVLVSGKAGMGKSAVAKKVLNSLKVKYSIIALRGEELDKTSISEILTSLNINKDLELLLNSYYFKPIKIILIESIEKLLETDNSETILDFFNLIRDRNDIKLVVTGRDHAIEQLKIRFLKELPVPVTITIPLLGEELGQVEMVYPHITKLLLKPGLKKLLQIPFNLDKAVYLGIDVFGDSVSTELDFKRIMWEYVIENKEKETDASVRKQRGELFSNIAFSRAVQMVPYVKVDNAQPQILQKLEEDNIIEVDSKLRNRYSPSHDIFEDWALTRTIEDKFSDWNGTSIQIIHFFNVIGSDPAIRRAFRIWLSERLQLPDSSIKDFFQLVLTQENVNQYWKDEVIIAIIQSSFSQELLSKNKELLFKDSFLLYKRCLLLLKVACQTPDFQIVKIMSEKRGEEQIAYQNHYLVPFGEGWLNVINFTFDHISELHDVYNDILLILLDWKKGLQEVEELPPESEKVALILLDYFDFIRAIYNSDNYYHAPDQKVSECISLLIRISGAVKVQITALIEEALIELEGDNYKIRDFKDKIVENVLSCLDSKWLCFHLPNLVCKVAEKTWFYFPPTKEEISEMEKRSPFSSISMRDEKEEIFGVNDMNTEYMPPSAMQTPIKHLLYFHPTLALNFIVKLFNHSVDAYFKSDFLSKDRVMLKADPRSELSFVFNQKEVNQKGSLTLWCMFSGGLIATPYLLQSILMALENWLLALSKQSQDSSDPNQKVWNRMLDSVLEILLLQSRSVSTTAVIISAATAYPRAFDRKVFPLLRVREFFKWDLHRLVQQREPFFFNDPQYLIDERRQSFSLPHRKLSMEDLLRKYTTSGFADEMYSILDSFYSEKPQETEWKIALNRMDFRKLEIVKQDSKGILVQTKVDQDLKGIAQENQRKQESIAPVLSAGNWCSKKFQRKPVEEDTYSEWKRHFHSVTNHDPSVPGIGIWVHKGFLAAVGIRDYIEQLTKDERLWCINAILEIIQAEIQKDPYGNYLEKASISAFDTEPALETLPILLRICDDTFKNTVKEFIFAALLYIDTEAEKNRLLGAVRNVLWDIDPQFSLCCASGMLEYSKVNFSRSKIRRWYPSEKKEKKEKEKLLNKFEKETQEIFNSVIAGTSAFNNNGISENTHSAWTLLNVVSMVPFNTKNPLLLAYIETVFNIVLNTRDGKLAYEANEKVPYQLSQLMEKYYARFLLSQDKSICIEKLKPLVDWVFESNYKQGRSKDKKFEFTENILDHLITIVDQDSSLRGNFWIIWEYLYMRSFETSKLYFGDVILLYSPSWKNSANSWTPLIGKKEFFKKAVPLFQNISSTSLLLGGIGFSELMPEGIEWYAALLGNTDPLLNATYNVDTERVVQRVFYNKEMRDRVKANASLRESFMAILDSLINRYSAAAFLIREDFISLKREPNN